MISQILLAAALNFNLLFSFSLVSFMFLFLIDGLPFSLTCVLLLYLKIRVNRSLERVSSRLGNSRSQSINCLARNLLHQCSRIATVTITTTMAATSILFHICFNFSVTKFFSHFLQACWSNISFLKFELPITYNYAHNLSTQIIRN